VIRRDPVPCFYVYRIEMDDHVQTGIVGGGSVAAYEVNRIRRHEHTRPDKEDDRVRQIDACNAQTGPALVGHRNSARLAAVIAATTGSPPACRIKAIDGNTHTIWVVDDREALGAIIREFDAMPALYIADGHHRSAAAARVARLRRQAGGASDGALASFLVVSFPIEEMKIFDYNRVVRDLNGMSPCEFLRELDDEFFVERVAQRTKPREPATFGLYLAGTWYELRPKRRLPTAEDPVARLDVSLLTDRLLAPLLDINDLRTDKRIDFVGGKRGLEELEKRVDSGEMSAAFALFPTRMEDLMAVADKGEVMPPKSTWFEPKLADGLVSYPLDWA
jgi:uncharacterized protein (DUF1015 family)